jgi:hypothetical protein
VTATAREAGPRPRALRRSDTEHRLAHDVDVWVATASADGIPYLVPLLATPAASPTGRNLSRTGVVRLALGATRDVTVIDGDVEVLPIDALPQDAGDRFAARSGFDPRPLPTEYRWYRITPHRIQAWREADELRGRELMRDGCWSTERA